MKTKILSVLLAGTILIGAMGELLPTASAVQEPDAPQAETFAAAESIAIHPKTLWLRAGETSALTATVLPEDSADPIIWNSSDPQVCTVSDDGTVTGIADGDAVVSAQTGAYQDVCTVHVGLAAPASLSVRMDETNHAVLTWDAVETCDGYRVYRRTSSEQAWTDVQTLAATSWTDPEAAESGWQYAVRAYKLRDSQTDDPKTLWSDYTAANAVPHETVTPPVTLKKPQIPSGLAAEAQSDGRVRISWSPVAGASGYRIYRKNGSDWQLLRILKDGADTSFEDMFVDPDTSYTYTVRSYVRGNGKMKLSDWNQTGISVRTVSLPMPQLKGVTSNGYNSLIFSWHPVRNADGYALYRRTSSTDEWKWSDLRRDVFLYSPCLYGDQGQKDIQ